jgi:F0F1-type ATP synthase membrane subunit b/b'|tara:strand:+ start:50 stop:451 length:402 start_codon:yes stop_codon:yes gene_type:complete
MISFLKKAKDFVVKYWKILVGIVYAIGVWVFFKGRADKVKEVLKVKEDSHKKQIDALNDNHAEEIALRDEALDKYHEIIAKIEKEYEGKKEELTDKKREEVKKLVAENSEDPSNLAKLISDKFGIVHVEGGSE